MKIKREKPFFSIIIPVYNVETYLEECIESVLQQDYDNYEIILIDDGSTDSSSSICDKYSKRNNIRVIHKENGGLSDARNTGMNYTSGEYIIFLDSDDFLMNNNFLKEADDLLGYVDECVDLIVFAYYKFYSNKKKVKVELPIQSPYIYLSMSELCEKNCFNVSAWGKIVRRNVLDSNNITFRKGVLSEDMEWGARLLVACANCVAWNSSAYAYRQREGSITKSVSMKLVNDVEDNLRRCIEIENLCNKEKRKAFISYIAMNVSMYVILLSLSNKEIWKQKEMRIEALKEYLIHSNRCRERMIYCSINIFGCTNTLRFLKTYSNIKEWKVGRYIAKRE